MCFHGSRSKAAHRHVPTSKTQTRHQSGSVSPLISPSSSFGLLQPKKGRACPPPAFSPFRLLTRTSVRRDGSVGGVPRRSFSFLELAGPDAKHIFIDSSSKQIQVSSPPVVVNQLPPATCPGRER
ncbi:uncharacterized protein LOC144010508 [Festucalex cinctus]